MKVLEQILKEIEKGFDKRVGTQLKIMAGLRDEVYRYGHGKSLEAYQQSKLLVEEIIRSHMEDDGWIPVEERLPEERAVNPVTRDAYVYPVAVDLGGVIDTRYYSFWKGHWYNQGPKIMDDMVIAWRTLPEPYRPKEN